ncbi:methyltransferase family protein [Ruegeria meonggei]|uniref:Isoprenylcysteine carboxyl methyltransferase (ICMT) family protein n=1 Tax=Ruegeria meonggei TaxID=1446476 RepID=A0A1X6ZBH3_9RHOB|nr:isoprenylcysteine carboxylmethyltransferase family protein [Ruegeria meonggei]SLN46443.1 Isoprenylcysteine carboxyl methyltransferase (ICMT) family protein [Ruegeria meonggei]
MRTAVRTDYNAGQSELGTDSAPSTRPASAVSEVTGLIGVVALFGAITAAIYFDTTLPQSIFLLMSGAAIPMIASTILLDKAHLRSSTGLDYGLNRQRSEVASITITKTLGLGATLFVIALAYQIIPTYDTSKYQIVRALTALVFPFLWVFSPVYIAFTTRHMIEPRDELWHFGKFVTFQFSAVDMTYVKDHCRAWLVKGFFLAFMVSILPMIVHSVVNSNLDRVFGEPVLIILYLVQVSFLVDVCIGTIGYVCTFKVLDSHIRSANPFLSGWVAALICYPPFVIMHSGGPLDYRGGTQEWGVWLADQPTVLILWGSVILLLAATYAWATVAFGIRFSNLTHRGIITTGPFRYVKHPAYLSKNLMWWMVYMPFLSVMGTTAAIQSCILLLGVNAVYFARAKTEEKHLMADEDYRKYAEWIRTNGLFARHLRRRDI